MRNILNYYFTEFDPLITTHLHKTISECNMLKMLNLANMFELEKSSNFVGSDYVSVASLEWT
jgi:hypothetical protein